MASIVTIGDAPDSDPATPAAPKPSLLAPPAKPPVTLRGFDDPRVTRQAIYDGVLQAARQMPTASNARYSLGLESPHWADPEHRSITDRKRAILRGESLQRRLRGTWVLKDATGNVVDSKLSTVAHVPHLTEQGTFVNNGSEYTLAHQMRLRPGIFTRQKENGELESHINVMPGKGLTHHYQLEPETGVFKLRVTQANMPLYPVLKAMGVTDADMRQAWGTGVHAANATKDDPKVVAKLYQRLLGSKAKPDATHEEKARAVADVFGAMEFDPEVTQRTLGKPHARLTKEAALDTTAKLLAVHRGKADTDDRDHLAYQTLLGPEDLFAERFRSSKKLLGELLWKATNKGHLQGLPVGAMTPHMQAVLLGSGLGQNLESVNPLDLLSQNHRVTRLGTGGIPSVDSAPDESRAVQPSQLNFVDAIIAPESSKAGLDNRLTSFVKKGSDGRLYAPFVDPRTGATVYKTPQDVQNLTVAFPGELEGTDRYISAQTGGKTRPVDRSQIDLAHPHAEHWFSPLTNLVPFKSAIKGHRASMAARFLIQAMPLEGAEAPLVRNQVPGVPGRSFEEHYGRHVGAVRAQDQSGRVAKVDAQGVTVNYADGTTETHPTYDNLPYNRKSGLHNTAMVKPGDPVQPGQLLAKSNYTDDQGHVALGKNLRVAYTSWAGLNHNDAYLISESAAAKLKSEHHYQHNLEWDDDHRRGTQQFASIFPGKFNKNQLGQLDQDGIVKPGTVIHAGDPLVVAAKTKELNHKQVHSAHKGTFQDASLTWDHHVDGVVTDVERTDKGVTVAVKSYHPMEEGDKMTGRAGDKGVVRILPDAEMPHDESGKAFDVVASDQGIITRANTGQVHEAALGKVAAHTGKPVVVNDFADIEDLSAHAQRELDKHGLKLSETIIDPKTGRRIPNVAAGTRYFLKLHHMAESKDQGRGLGMYTAEGAPAKTGGAEGSSKRSALMNSHAMLSHNAVQVLRDVKMVRGQKNQEYWSTVMAGNRPPTPNVPHVYEKFINQLKASGINVTRQGTQSHLLELTNKDIVGLAGDRELQNAETVDWQGMKPVAGGLFDEKLTGGHNHPGRWAKITLHEPMPSPVMEEPIRRLLGLTKDKFEQVIAGKHELEGQTGPTAIARALDRVDVTKSLAQARADIASGKKTRRDEAVRKLFYLKAAEDKGIHPREWMLNAVPVLPPAFRPVSTMQGSGSRLFGDANLLYKELFDANKGLKELSGVSNDTGDARLALYQAFKGVTGLGDPIQTKNRDKQVTGFLGHVLGNGPKHSIVQQKLLATPVDLVGRTVIVPNPDLNMDQIGLPENRAWTVYTPFVVRNLVKKGVPRVQAMEYVRDRHDAARKALLDEMGKRPVIATRAPVLHRFGELAFWPRLVKGDTLHMSPVVYEGAGADNDGDAMNYHVPASDEAASEAAEKMLPSKNLLSVKGFKADVFRPVQDYASGLNHATRRVDATRRPRVFATGADLKRAWDAGELDPDQPVTVVEHRK
jgi:DNA-directed RNA polymerase subunit beta